MDYDSIPEFPAFNSNKLVKTYPKAKKSRIVKQEVEKPQIPIRIEVKKEALTSKNALIFMLEGCLRLKVCRYCLHETPLLSELEQILQIATPRGIYKISIKEIIASFYPVKISEDKNFPDKICNKCLSSALSSYLFAQQCEQAERALRNCFEDIYEKFEKIDPLERPKKRGRQKLNPNYNKIYVEHKNVMDYAEPIINLKNTSTESLTKEEKLQDYECLKCCEVLPNVESLLNHEKLHPKSMWYHCRICGKAYPKRHQVKKHFITHAREEVEIPDHSFSCKICNYNTKEYNVYLQHIEKHKFQELLQDLIDRKTDKFCSICLKKKDRLFDMESMLCLHGGCPELSGDRSLYKIVSSMLPEINASRTMGTKICEKCLDHAIIAYVFVNQFYFTRNRLEICINSLTNGLNVVDASKGNVFAEISLSTIMPIQNSLSLFSTQDEPSDEKELKVDVLEDEFRQQDETGDDKTDSEDERDNCREDIEAPLPKHNLVNGYEDLDPMSRVSEFLTFKKPVLRKPKPAAENYTCPLCYKNFISDYFLKRHIVRHANRNVQCGACLQVFKTKFNFIEHVKSAHRTNVKPLIKCEICERHVSLKKLESHTRAHSETNCVLCGKVFVSVKHYRAHMERHALKLRLIRRRYVKTCGFCEKECANKNALTAHVNKVHLQVKPYACDMCEKQFYTEYDLRCHMKLHSSKSKERCELCFKVLRSRSQLVAHIRKHMGVRPYACQLCNHTFYSQNKTYVHMRRRHGGIHVCKFCKTAYSTQRKLEIHTQTSHSVI